ncbi:UBL3 [Cordylochernes scorpioides]|uniref:UBL3 n=1 Tax=Cordylochernes scorpioides TaxID=51811 RepID=A0ABY6L340_9ARAC|nr:UBL3 [Cordylochernes scorpioides]
MYRLQRKMSEEWREVIHWSSDLMTTSATTVERGLPMGEPLVCLKNWVSNVKVDMPRHMEVSSTTVSAINLKLILVSGKTQEFLFSPNDAATDIAQYVFENWPPEDMDCILK